MGRKDSTPEPEDPSEAVNEFFNMFGGKKEAESFMAEAELAASTEAWESLYIMYQGLQMGGFSRSEAMELIVTYMIKTVGGSD